RAAAGLARRPPGRPAAELHNSTSSYASQILLEARVNETPAGQAWSTLARHLLSKDSPKTVERPGACCPAPDRRCAARPGGTAADCATAGGGCRPTAEPATRPRGGPFRSSWLRAW